MQLHETNSPFNPEQAELLSRLLPSLSASQRIWLSGYLSATPGVAVAEAPAPIAPAAVAGAGVPAASAPAVSKEVTILYGSQTGNSQGLAEQFGKKLGDNGYDVTVVSMGDFKTRELKKLKNLLVVVSTHGEGDPPDSALPFYEFLHGKRAPKLDDLRFSVLSLGDMSYEFFCQTGKDFDKRLEELGATRLSDRVDCDLDYDEPAEQWIENVLNALNEATSGPAPGIEQAASALAAAPALGATAAMPSATEQPAYSRTNPFYAEVLDNLNLNGRGSARETRHLELSLEGSGLEYEPGDCIAIYPENHPELVEELIRVSGWDAESTVPVGKGDSAPLREALSRHYEITVLTKPLLEKAASLSADKALEQLVQSPEKVREYIEGRDLLDLIQDFGPWQATASDFVSILRKLPARQYSIASSLNAYPDEAHLTIRTVRYESHGRDRYGVCSVQCAERLEPGDTVPIYVQKNPNFKLPHNTDTPIIMVGPGTGVAPFRAFMQEREEIGAEGKSWLFYGDQHFVTDFLYQTEWQQWLKDGVLTRMDVAFSRDTDRKIYVQHRMMEKKKELYAWLEEGAHVYVCGDEKHMAHDVHETLLVILEQEGGMSRADAEAYLSGMQQQKRYQRDVY